MIHRPIKIPLTVCVFLICFVLISDWVLLSKTNEKKSNERKKKLLNEMCWKRLTNLWHFVPMNAAIMLQYSHAVGLPCCLTLNSHFLQMADVLPLLQVCIVCFDSLTIFFFCLSQANIWSSILECNFVVGLFRYRFFKRNIKTKKSINLLWPMFFFSRVLDLLNQFLFAFFFFWLYCPIY